MKLFLKHIIRSIKKSPLQPIIILITLIVAVTTFVTVTKLAYKEHQHYNSGESTADITVKLSQSDDVRILFIEDAQSIVGEEGNVQGELELTALINTDSGNDFFEICATDFYTAPDFYDFKFTEYGEITEKNVNTSIIISAEAKEKYGLEIGDVLTLNFLNTEFNMRVEAVCLAYHSSFESDGIIHTGSIARALANANPAISSLGDSIAPYTSLRIAINDSTRVDEFIEKFSSDSRFSEKLIIKEAENRGTRDFFTLVTTLLIIVSASIVTAISAIVIFTALDLLSKERIKDSALFMISGASNRDLNRILHLECLVYGIISALFAVLILPFFINEINSAIKWENVDLFFEPYDSVTALTVAPVLVLITAFAFARRTKKISVSERIIGRLESKTSSSAVRLPIIFLLALILLFTVTSLIAPRRRFLSGFVCLLPLMCFIYTFVPHFLRWVSLLFIRLAEKCTKAPPRILMALKNASVSYSIKHTSRLIAILASLVCTVFACLNALNDQTGFLKSIVDCRYISVNADAKTDEILAEFDTVEDVYRISITKQLMTEQETGVLGISVSEGAEDKLNPEIAPKKMPRGDEIVITTGVALLADTRVGDYITLNHPANDYTFKVIEVMPAGANIVFFDSSHIGAECDLLCIETEVQKNTEEYKSIANALEVRGASILERDTVLSPFVSKIDSYSTLISCLIYIAIFFQI